MADARRPTAPGRPPAPTKPRSGSASRTSQRPSGGRAPAPSATGPRAAAGASAPRTSARKGATSAARTAPTSAKVAASGRASAKAAPGASPATQATPRAGRLRLWARSLRRSGSDEAATGAVPTVAEPATVGTPWARVSTRLSSAVVTSRMQERLKERRSVERRVRAIRWGKRVAIAGVVVGAGYLVLMSPFLEFDEAAVEASGYGSVVDPAQVDDVLAAYDGSALVTLNTAHVENQLTDIVGVSAAQVEKVWPTGLRVTLTPSEPVAAIPADGGFALVTQTGEQVSESEEAPANLPVVRVPVGEEHERILSGVLGVLEQTPVALRESIENVEADTEDSIHFVLRAGPRVEWGSVEDSEVKADVLEVLLASPETEKATVIDVSAPTLPTVATD